MSDRKQKVEELLENFASMKRNISFGAHTRGKVPRITPSQWGVLMLIKQKESSSVKEIAAALHVSSSAATQLVDGLVKSGYVKREEKASDRRAVTLSLSKKSKTHVGEMKKKAVQKFLKIFIPLSDREFAEYVRLTNKIAAATKK